jgi:hypothetical protein
MDEILSPPNPWTSGRPWPSVRRAPSVVVLAGIDWSGIVGAALEDPALSETLLPRFEPDCAPPCDAQLWRLETGAGVPLNQGGGLARHWHRKPYAITVRLARYRPGSDTPEVLDEGTIGTRGPWDAFTAAVGRLAMRFVRDAALGRSRGPSARRPAARPSGAPGWLDYARARWHDRVMTEWWSLGSTATPVARILDGGGLNPIEWYEPAAGERYLADPFPWPGTGMILCEDMPVAGGVGRIVGVRRTGDTLSPPVLTVLEDQWHHSYPCTFQDRGTVYCVPETTERGMTRVFELRDDGTLRPVCEVAPHARLADPTLFKVGPTYWLACTDLDVGGHDNLCLLHAASPSGPWAAHAKWPVRIDVRGARSAGSVMAFDGRLFRPGQDCAATYGAAIALHEITRLTPTEFAETLVRVLRPERGGPFPHGMHTMTHDGERFWFDGKRFVMNRGLLRTKLRKRLGINRVQPGAA